METTFHLTDHCVKLSPSTVIPNKQPYNIKKVIFKIQISVYPTAEKVLTDNRDDFFPK